MWVASLVFFLSSFFIPIFLYCLLLYCQMWCFSVLLLLKWNESNNKMVDLPLWLHSHCCLKASPLSRRFFICFLRFPSSSRSSIWTTDGENANRQPFFPLTLLFTLRNLRWEFTDWSGTLGYTTVVGYDTISYAFLLSLPSQRMKRLFPDFHSNFSSFL